MGNVIEYRSPREREEYTAFVGMVIFLGSWAMVFCGLFMAYGLLRARAGAWPPPEQPRPGLLPCGVTTLVLLLSSALLHAAALRLRAGGQRAAAVRALLATGLGALFAAGQVAVWAQLRAGGLTLSSSPFGSIYYALTGFHLLHVVVGLAALAWLSWRLWTGLTNPARHLALRLWAMYWHFVGVVWLLMFLALVVF